MAHSENQELIHASELMKQGKINEAYQIVLELENKDDLFPQELLFCKLLKANFLYKSLKFSDAITYTNQILKESQKQGDLVIFFDALTIQLFSNIILGNLKKSEDLIQEAEDIFNKIKGTSNIELKERESFLVRIKANIYAQKGDFHRALELNKKAFELAKDSDNKELTSASLINIAEQLHFLRDYDNAKIYAVHAIKIQYLPWLIYQLGFLVYILIAKGDIEEANYYFQQIKEIRDKDKTRINDIFYRYYKAILLKTSLRSKDRVKSEKLLKDIIDNKDFITEQDHVFAIIHLCDLLLIELRITNYPEVIDEIQLYIERLLDFTERYGSYRILCETHLLQAKLSLLTFDINKAKRFLTQAKQIAERFNLTKLAIKINNEKKDLFEKEGLWEKLKTESASMTKRIDLARLEEQLEEMVRNPPIQPAYIREEKVTISKETKICLVCRGEVLRFTYICKCGTIYCENCARALSNLENICWNCESPIDYLKPVKPSKEEVEEIDIDIKGKK